MNHLFTEWKLYHWIWLLFGIILITSTNRQGTSVTKPTYTCRLQKLMIDLQFGHWSQVSKDRRNGTLKTVGAQISKANAQKQTSNVLYLTVKIENSRKYNLLKPTFAFAACDGNGWEVGAYRMTSACIRPSTSGIRPLNLFDSKDLRTVHSGHTSARMTQGVTNLPDEI